VYFFGAELYWILTWPIDLHIHSSEYYNQIKYIIYFVIWKQIGMFFRHDPYITTFKMRFRDKHNAFCFEVQHVICDRPSNCETVLFSEIKVSTIFA
jgi:hypothetical protein